MIQRPKIYNNILLLLSPLEDIKVPEKLMDFVELVLDAETESRLIEQKRVPGENNVGMVAWRLTIYTPEYPAGRDIIVIANDITFAIGSFGPREDKVFGLASEISRDLKIPRVSIDNLTVHSGSLTAKF